MTVWAKYAPRYDSDGGIAPITLYNTKVQGTSCKRTYGPRVVSLSGGWSPILRTATDFYLSPVVPVDVLPSPRFKKKEKNFKKGTFGPEWYRWVEAGPPSSELQRKSVKFNVAQN